VAAVAVLLAVPVAAAPKQRGINFACAFARDRDIRYGSAASLESLRNARKLGVDAISIMPFGFQSATPHVRMGGYETDESLAAATRQAHSLGMKVLLKPHVWIRDEAAMTRFDAADWQSWFADYEQFITHYATLARDNKMDALSIGNELKHATRGHEREWRRIIARVRAIYRGPLTYGANFDEVFDVPFWDALDWIGVSAYFPLVDAPMPSRAALVAAWKPIVARLGALSARAKRPVVITEFGYRSADGAAWRQWEIPRNARTNDEAQRVAYEAFFEAVWPQPFIAGAYAWKWFSAPAYREHGDNEYEFENKPAAAVLRRAYTSTTASSSSSRR
jgi:hypothetical protein